MKPMQWRSRGGGGTGGENGKERSGLPKVVGTGKIGEKCHDIA